MPKSKISSTSKSSKSKRPRGRPVTRVIESIDVPLEDIARAIFRVADVKRDAKVKKSN